MPNRPYLHALWKLSWLSDGQSMVPVNWRAMQTAELGSVYESLLELQPHIDGTRLVFATDAAENSSLRAILGCKAARDAISMPSFIFARLWKKPSEGLYTQDGKIICDKYHYKQILERIPRSWIEGFGGAAARTTARTVQRIQSTQRRKWSQFM